MPLQNDEQYPVLTTIINEVQSLKDTYVGALNGSTDTKNAIEIANARIGEVDLFTKISKIDKSINDIMVIDVKSLGAKGDGITDDTIAIQNALSYNTNGRLRHIKISDGDYMVNPYTKLIVSSNTKIEFSQSARLIAINTNHDISSMLDVRNVQNVEIINPTIIGDKDTNTAITEGAGHGITCINVTNLIIRGANISKCFTDGIYLNNVINTLVDFCICDNSGRQGLTITSAKNLLVRNSIFKNSNRVPPMMGIDIEPNYTTDILENVRLENIKTETNVASGIGINLNNLNDTSQVVDIIIDGFIDNGSKKAFSATKYNGNVSELSTIIVNNLKGINNVDCAINVVGYKADGTPKLTFNRPRVYNCNTGNGTNERSQNVAISVNNETTGYPVGTPIGNVDFVEPYIDMLSGRSILRGIYIGYNELFKKVSVINPIKINTGATNLSQNNNYSKITFFGAGQGDIYLQDKYNALSLTTNYSLIKGYGLQCYSKYICNATIGTSTFQDFNNWNVSSDEIFVINNNNAGINCIVKIPTVSGITFLDETNANLDTKTYTTSTVNAMLRFKKISSSLIKVYKENGTWTVA